MNELQTEKKSFRESIIKAQEYVTGLPGSVQGEDLDRMCPLKHSFAPSMYVREIFIPKGTVIVGKIHKHEHPNFLMKGKVVVVTEGGGEQHLKAPMSMISPAGTKRFILAKTDTVWITVHENKNNSQDLKELEDFIIAKTFEEYDEFKKLQGRESERIS